MRAGNRAEAKGHEGPAPGFTALNAGKRSIALDFRDPAGQAALLELVKTADAFVENFRPGVMAKYGLDQAAITAIKPDIVYCSISGFGQKGAWSGRGAYDHIVQAMTGVMMLNGEGEEAPPMKIGFPVVDVATGLLAALAIVAALMRRQRDGQGDRIDASMIQASLALMYPMASNFLTTGNKPGRIGNRGFSGSPAADTYRCADGWLSVAANTPAQFRKLTQLLGLEALCEDPEILDLDAFNAANSGFVYARNATVIRERIAERLRDQLAQEWEHSLNAAGVPAARVRRLGEFLSEIGDDESLALPRMQLSDDARPVWNAGLGFEMASLKGRVVANAPALGADTTALLESAGMSKLEIEKLVDAGLAFSGNEDRYAELPSHSR